MWSVDCRGGEVWWNCGGETNGMDVFECVCREDSACCCQVLWRFRLSMSMLHHVECLLKRSAHSAEPRPASRRACVSVICESVDLLIC